jgi:hypothetical protein
MKLHSLPVRFKYEENMMHVVTCHDDGHNAQLAPFEAGSWNLADGIWHQAWVAKVCTLNGISNRTNILFL